MLFGFKTNKQLRRELSEANNLNNVLMQANVLYSNALTKYHESVSDYLNRDRGNKKQLREYSEAIYNNLMHDLNNVTRG